MWKIKNNKDGDIEDGDKLLYEWHPKTKAVILPGGGIAAVVDDGSDEEQESEEDIFENLRKQIQENFDNAVDIKDPESPGEVLEESQEKERKERMRKTEEDYTRCINQCRDIFLDKLGVFGPSWRILHPESITDQVYIRIRKAINLFDSTNNLNHSEIVSEIMAIVNYSFIYLIQYETGRSDVKDISNDDAVLMFDRVLQKAYDFMMLKNSTQYNESWRLMRFCSFLDFILMKVMRIREVENSVTTVTEDVQNYYFDIINYAIFALIRLN